MSDDNSTPASPRCEVIAHRGASRVAPENTMAAFREAHRAGAPWLELDCTLSKDDHVVVIHDDKVDRTTPGTGRVADLTLEQLRALDAGSWKDARFAAERIPTLREVLDWAAGEPGFGGRIGVYVEVKNAADDSQLMEAILAAADDHPRRDAALSKEMLQQIEVSGTRNLGLSRAVIREIRARELPAGVVVQSFSPIVCAIVAIEAPELRVELLASAPTDRADSSARWERILRWLYLLDLPGLNISESSVTPGRLAALQAAGRTVAVWTVNDPDDMQRLARLGVNRIISDVPDIARKALAPPDEATD